MNTNETQPKKLKVYRFHTGEAEEDVFKSNVYSHKEINSIKDPSGATDKLEITSIPSPFARMNLINTAFKEINNRVFKDKNDFDYLEGNSIYHKLVSDCFDIGEIFFNYSKLKESGANIEIISWDSGIYYANNQLEIKKDSDLGKLIQSQVKEHKLLGQTLSLFIKQDQSSFHFNKLNQLFLIKYDHQIMGSTSPITLFLTTANNLRTNIIFGEHKLFDTQNYLPLYKRDSDFQKYLYFLRKLIPDFETIYATIYTYLENNLKRLLNYNQNQKLYGEIKDIIEKYDNNNFNNNFDSLEISKGNPIEILNFELRQKKQGVIESDFEINCSSTKVNPKNPPLVLQNDFTKPLNYFNGLWDKNIKVPYFDERDIDNRILPGRNFKYPYITVSDFLEPYIIRLTYPINEEKFFNGNLIDNKKGYLLPLKQEFFKYFSIDDIITNKNKEPGKPFIEIEPVLEGVKVSLYIPIKKEGELILFERIYFPPSYKRENIIESFQEPDQKINKGAIIESEIGLVVFPSIKYNLETAPFYRILFIDHDISNITQNNKFELKYLTEISTNLEFFIPANTKRRTNKKDNTGNAISDFYILDKNFDLISIVVQTKNKKISGLLIPIFTPQESNTEEKYRFAIDFGTSYTHIEYSLNEGKPRPFDISQKEIQYSTLHKSNAESPEIRDIILQTFVPEIIGENSIFDFPIRTVISYNRAINFTSLDNFVLADLNIPFIYEKENIKDYNKETTHLKWANYTKDKADELKVKSFLENLLILIRNKILFNKGNLEETEFICFYPSSMIEDRRNKLIDEWKKLYKKYFIKLYKEQSKEDDAKLDDEIISKKLNFIPESLAPFYFYHETDNTLAQHYPVISIDIGGETTDIVIYSEDKPYLLTSFRFAANSIFGDGYGGSPNKNGFVRRFKKEFENILLKNELEQLNKVLNALCNKGNSADINTFLFSIYETIQKDKKISDKDLLSYAKMLSDAKDLKIVFLVFYAAIIYHIALIMKVQCPGRLPRFITFSGNGSKLLDILSPSNKTLENYTKIIFEEIFGITYYKDGLNIKRNKLIPKQVTCKGPLLTVVPKINIENINCILFATDKNTFVKNYDSFKSDYIEKNRTDISVKVADEVNEFINFFFSLNNKFNYNDKFGVDNSRINNYKTILNHDLESFILKGISDTLNEMNDKTKPIPETLFFYAFKGTLPELANEIVSDFNQ